MQVAASRPNFISVSPLVDRSSMTNNKVQIPVSPNTLDNNFEPYNHNAILDEEIGLYTTTSASKKITSENKTNFENVELKPRLSVVPNQGYLLSPISVTGGSWGSGGYGFGGGHSGSGHMSDPSAYSSMVMYYIAGVSLQAFDYFEKNNAPAVGESIFGRPLNKNDIALWRYVATEEIKRTLQITKGFLAGKQALVDTNEAREFQFTRLKSILVLREGERLDVYPDQYGNPTVGVGHLVKPNDNLKIGDRITRERLDTLLRNDTAWALNAARRQAKDAGITSSKFITALANANFNMGDFTTDFPIAWNHIKSARFDQAIGEISNSKWARDTPTRSNDFIGAIRELAKVHGK